MGKILILLGLILLVSGLLITYFPGLRIGRLPGDITIELKNSRIYLPIASSILLSILLSLAFWLITWFRR